MKTFKVDLYPDYCTENNKTILSKYFKPVYESIENLVNDINKAFGASGAFIITAIFIHEKEGEQSKNLSLPEFKTLYLDERT